MKQYMELILIALGIVVFVFGFRKALNRKSQKTDTKQNRGMQSEKVKHLNYTIPAQTTIHDLYLKKHNSSNTQSEWALALNPNRGTQSERDLVLKLLKNGIPAQTIFHDLYLKKHNGNFSQIDLVVATKVGIIVFEVKDYSGWIFGKGYQEQWTQVLAHGTQKYRFYNPIKQNNKHIEDLRKKLKQLNVPFYSVVVFYGDCELRDVSFVPEGTFIVKSNRVLDVVRTIMSNNNPAQYTDKHEVVRILKEAVKKGENPEVQNQHIANIEDMLGKDRIFD